MDQISTENRTICAFGLRYVGYPLVNALSQYLRIIICSLRWIEPGDVNRMVEKVPVTTYNRKLFIASTVGCGVGLHHMLWNILLILNRGWQVNYASLIEMTANSEWMSRRESVVLTKPDPFRSDFERSKLLSGGAAR